MAEIEVIVEPIASEDINWKAGSKLSAETFTRTTSDGGTQVVHKVSAQTIPMEDDGDMWVPFDISTLEELIISWINGTAPFLNKGKMIQVKMGGDSSLASLIGTNAQGKVVTELPWGDCMSMHPVGTIIPWMPGYFTGENSGFVRASFLTSELSEPSLVVACNTFLTPFGWRVCDGTAPNDPGSPIWDSAGKLVPLLIDERFLMGVSGPVTMDEGEEWEEDVWAAGFNGHHVHGILQHFLTVAELPPHHHSYEASTAVGTGLWSAETDYGPLEVDTEDTGEGLDHDHGFDGANLVTLLETHTLYNPWGVAYEVDVVKGTTWESVGDSAKETVGIDNRPKWLGVIYIIRIK